MRYPVPELHIHTVQRTTQNVHPIKNLNFEFNHLNFNDAGCFDIYVPAADVLSLPHYSASKPARNGTNLQAVHQLCAATSWNVRFALNLTTMRIGLPLFLHASAEKLCAFLASCYDLSQPLDVRIVR